MQRPRDRKDSRDQSRRERVRKSNTRFQVIVGAQRLWAGAWRLRNTAQLYRAVFPALEISCRLGHCLFLATVSSWTRLVESVCLNSLFQSSSGQRRAAWVPSWMLTQYFAPMWAPRKNDPWFICLRSSRHLARDGRKREQSLAVLCKA